MELMQGVAAATATVAAVIDVRSRRIPNWVSGSALLVGAFVHAWLDGWNGVLLSLTGAALGLAILLPLYAINAMGAGDVKLLGGLGALVGPHALVSIAIYGAIAGGVMSAFVLIRRQRLAAFFRDVALLHRAPTRSGAKAPYGVALASGVYLSLFLPSVLS
jgi:prepilin peptidase CpaA